MLKFETRAQAAPLRAPHLRTNGKNATKAPSESYSTPKPRSRVTRAHNGRKPRAQGAPAATSGKCWLSAGWVDLPTSCGVGGLSGLLGLHLSPLSIRAPVGRPESLRDPQPRGAAGARPRSLTGVHPEWKRTENDMPQMT